MPNTSLSENTQHQPLVSVLCFAYNAEKFLKECIDSILNQTYRNIELIFVDNGSGDKTYDIIKSYNDDRIKIYRILTNRGPNIGYFKCFEHAAGEYVAWISADDVWLPEKLEKQMNFLLANTSKGYVGCFTQWENIDEFGNKYEAEGINSHTFSDTHPINKTKEEFIRTIYNCQEFPFAQPSFVCRTDILKEVDTMEGSILLQAHDYWVWLKILMKYELAIIEEPLLYYRRHGNNHSKAVPNYTMVGLIEWKYVIRQLFNLSDWELLNKVFPEIRAMWNDAVPELKDFYIAMITLQNASFIWQQVGCDKLHELLQNKEMADLIENKYRFGPWELVRLQENYDPYHMRNFLIGYIDASLTDKNNNKFVIESKYFYNSGVTCDIGYQNNTNKFKVIQFSLSRNNLVYFNIKRLNFTAFDGLQYSVKFNDILNSNKYLFATSDNTTVQLLMPDNTILLGHYIVYVPSKFSDGMRLVFSKDINQFSMTFSADLLINGQDASIRISRVIYKGWRLWLRTSIKYIIAKLKSKVIK